MIEVCREKEYGCKRIEINEMVWNKWNEWNLFYEMGQSFKVLMHYERG